MPDGPSFDLERFKERAALEVQKNPDGEQCQIGTVTRRPASYLYRIWKDPVLYDAFIDGEKLRALVASSSPCTPLATRESRIVRQTPKDENARPQEGRIEEWQQLLSKNILAFEEAAAKAINTFRVEVAETRGLPTTTPKGNSMERDEMKPPTEGDRQSDLAPDRPTHQTPSGARSAATPDLEPSARDSAPVRPKRGRRQILEQDQQKLAKIIAPHLKDDAWKAPSILEKICRKLDKAKVKRTDGRSWERIFEDDQANGTRKVVDLIDYRLYKSSNPAKQYLSQ